MKRDALDKSPFSFAGVQGVSPRQNKNPCRTEAQGICHEEERNVRQTFSGNDRLLQR